MIVRVGYSLTEVNPIHTTHPTRTLDTTSQVATMSFRPSFFRSSKMKARQTTTKPRVSILRPSLAQLEDRWNPTFLFVDFGDRFQQGGLSDTLINFQNAKSGSNPIVNGPDLVGFTGNPNSNLTLLPFDSVYGSSSTANRSAIMSLLNRYYEALDITVVELKATPVTVGGFTFTAAATLADVSVTIGKNEGSGKDKDTYAFMADRKSVV